MDIHRRILLDYESSTGPSAVPRATGFPYTMPSHRALVALCVGGFSFYYGREKRGRIFHHLNFCDFDCGSTCDRGRFSAAALAELDKYLFAPQLGNDIQYYQSNIYWPSDRYIKMDALPGNFASHIQGDSHFWLEPNNVCYYLDLFHPSASAVLLSRT